MSSIARAFTLRRKKADSLTSEDNVPVPTTPPRAASMRYSEKPIDIRKISAPVQLLSTTNMLTYNAPDVSVVQAQRKASPSVSSGTSSRSSTDGSDASSISNRSRDTHSTDVSSIGSDSPTSSPQSDKKASYFESTPAARGASTLRRSISTLEIRHSAQKPELRDDPPRSESPVIPQRAPSHSKMAHEALARKRSMQGMSRASSVSSISSTQREVRRSSMDFFNGKANDSTSTAAPAPHPFGKELEQLDEVAEEFNGAIHDVERANDMRVMQQRGLVKFRVDDYLAEIEPLFGGMFGRSNRLTVPDMAWI